MVNAMAFMQHIVLPDAQSAFSRRFGASYIAVFQVLFFVLSASLFAASFTRSNSPVSSETLLAANDPASFRAGVAVDVAAGSATAGGTCACKECDLCKPCKICEPCRGESSAVTASIKPTSDNLKPSRFLIGDHGFPGPVPWQWIRPSLRDEFTIQGKIQVVEWFLDTDRPDSGAIPNVWTNDRIETERDMARARNPNFGNYMPEDTAMFFEAFEKHPIKGKSVLVIGSQWPWVEAICLAFESGMITTVDFNKPIAKFPGMRQISVAELEGTEEQFDVAVSYSSLEHDGLGRYGDPVNPNGDLERMEKIRGLVKPNGLFFLGVPVGNDTIVFNAHRIYGPIRMPSLTSGWKLLDVFGGKTLEEIYRENLNQQVIQPLVVLSLQS